MHEKKEMVPISPSKDHGVEKHKNNKHPVKRNQGI